LSRKSEIAEHNEADKRPYLWYGEVYNADKYVDLRYSECIHLLSPRIRDGVKILDIGGYTAKLLGLLPPSVEYYDVDFDEGALQTAMKKGAKVLKVDLEEEEIPLTSKFDIIVVTELLEHLKDPEKLVLQIKKLLKDGGVVLISLPNECTLYHRLKVFFGKGVDGTGFAPHYHLHFPTINQNNEFVRRHFKIIEKRYFVHTDVGGKAGKVLSKIPIGFWMMLANARPSLFARGVIFLCEQKL
jgi:SAM-dependent methyltransferase